jgi:hypothetical protein
MPLAALKDSPVHYRLRAAQIGTLLNELAAGAELPRVISPSFEEDLMPDTYSGFACPECSGPLFKTERGFEDFRCLVGHQFSLPALLEESSSAQERKMYEAVLALEQGALLAEYAVEKVSAEFRTQLSEEAIQLRADAETIRKLLETRKITQIG